MHYAHGAAKYLAVVAAFLLAAGVAGCGLGTGAPGAPGTVLDDTGIRDEGTPELPPPPPPPPPPPDDPAPPPVSDPFALDTGTRGGPVVDPESEADDPGVRFGELKQLKVEVAFHGASGQTVTDENGITYIVGSWASHEDKVYPSEYWGTFPLYFFGDEVGVTVALTNLGPRKSFNVVVRTEAYVLRTDGSNGAMLLAPTETEVEVLRDQTVTLDGSFVAQYVAGAESGLDRFIVKILHPNVVDNPDGDEPALVVEKEAIFCPPEHEPPAF